MAKTKKSVGKNLKDASARQSSAADRRRKEFTIEELSKIAARLGELRADLAGQIAALEELQVERVTVDGATKHELAERELVMFLANVEAAVKRAKYGFAT